jgi:hypothetical protein
MENLKYKMREMFEQRRGITSENDKFLDDGLLKKILNLSILNPSTFEYSPYSILAVTTRENKYKLYNSMDLNRYIMDSAAILLLYGQNSEKDSIKAEYTSNLVKIALKYASKYYGVDSIIIKEGIKLPDCLVSERNGSYPDMLACLGYFHSAECNTLKKTTLEYSKVVREI